MRYIEKTEIGYLKEKYKYIVGWGPDRFEFGRLYNRNQYNLDYMIDGLEGPRSGTVIKDVFISKTDVIKKFADEKTCIVIFPHIEPEIAEQISELVPNADTIVARLVDWGGGRRTYSTDKEDIILLSIADALKLGDFSYLDIGVCHPVIRNNTFMFYEQGFTNGVLVEPNSEMADLAEIYRPKNRVLRFGATAGENGMLGYFSRHSSPGLNTFVKKYANVRGLTDYKLAPTVNINQIIEENLSGSVDILDLDAEAMDYDLLKAVMQNGKNKINVICTEANVATHNQFNSLLSPYGYSYYVSTLENEIYVRTEFIKDLPPKDKILTK